jgi:hypothetical protein
MALREAEGELDGHVLVVAGANHAGKTPLLRGIDTLIYGPKAAPDVPIRKGAMESVLEGTIEDPAMTIKRKVWWKVDEDTGELADIKWALELREDRGDGKMRPVSRAQGTLDTLFGARCSDVREFALLSETAKGRREQFERLQAMMGVDTSDLDERQKDAEEDRLMAGRDLKRLTGAMESAGLPPRDTPDEPVSVAELSEQLESARETRMANEGVRVQLRVAEEQYEAEMASAAELSQQLASAKARAQRFADMSKDLAKQCEALTDIDTAPIQEQIANAEAINAAVAQKQQYEQLKADRKEAVGFVKDAENALTAIAEERKARMAAGAASIGIEGLSLDAEKGEVLFNDIPSSQWGSSESIENAAKIQHGANPDGILLVREASLCDETILSNLSDWAESEGVTLILEVHGASENADLVITATEDGSVATKGDA